MTVTGRQQETSKRKANGGGYRQISRSLLPPYSHLTTFLHPAPWRPSPARTSHWAPLLGPPPTLFLQSEEMGERPGNETPGLSSPHSSQGPQSMPCGRPGSCEKEGGPGGARPLRQIPGGPQDGHEDRSRENELSRETSKMEKAVGLGLPMTREVRESRCEWRGDQQTVGKGSRETRRQEEGGGLRPSHKEQ